ncbi:unnamed protein product [Parascedosporium putredinis]|uniref:Fatty acid desaturase domain-containing protein n=1 Tax=Parascedosporium putredinis TaxID=1442378 RepID=A0A9P1H1B2_9PEZI|nr:unnamed protein product [Parascedosporium putredinis]CAI7992558.1 unnamed protein product [Parascedosporium putredinis]
MSSVAATMAAFFLWLKPASKTESTSVPGATQTNAGKATKKQTVIERTPREYPDINTIRNAIPAHCFQPSLWISCAYLVRDALFIAALAYAAITYIPGIEDARVRGAAWVAYGFVQGLVCTGLWILAHECGHGAFSLYPRVNNVIGWAAHSFLMVPYFSWKYSHARHHRFTGHMEKDMAFVPRTEAEHKERRILGIRVEDDLFEDAPIVALVRLLTHQLFGWQAYLLFNVTRGVDSLQREPSSWWPQSHFDPMSPIFRPSERFWVFVTDIGLLITASMIYYGATIVGGWNMFLLYAVPYFWVHHWLGLLATVDRDFGFIGRYLFHGIIETHVQNPLYYADEATEAIKPILGDLYHCDHSFLDQLWPTFTECKYVVPVEEVPGEMYWAHTVKKSQ